MDETCTLLLFLAHPALTPLAKGVNPECAGTFVCPSSHSDALRLLDEVLGRDNLSRVRTGDAMTFSLAADWGRFEDLKAQVREQGYGLRMMGMPPRS